MPLPAPAALLMGGRCRPQRPWGSTGAACGMLIPLVSKDASSLLPPPGSTAYHAVHAPPMQSHAGLQAAIGGVSCTI